MLRFPFSLREKGNFSKAPSPPPPPRAYEEVLFCLLQSEVAFCCVSLSEVNRSQLATTGKNEKGYSWHVPATKFIGVK